MNRIRCFFVVAGGWGRKALPCGNNKIRATRETKSPPPTRFENASLEIVLKGSSVSSARSRGVRVSRVFWSSLVARSYRRRGRERYAKPLFVRVPFKRSRPVRPTSKAAHAIKKPSPCPAGAPEPSICRHLSRRRTRVSNA